LQHHCSNPYVYFGAVLFMKTALYVSTTLLSTFIHSLCCLLPLLTALIGFGGVSSLGWLLQYQAYIVGFQVALMAWSFYQVYAGHQQATAAHLRREKLLLWSIAAVSVAAAVLPHSGWLRTEKQQLTAEQIQRVLTTRKLTLKIEQVSPTSQSVEQALANINGVVDSQITYRNGSATLRYHLKETSQMLIVEALRKQGFRAVAQGDALASR
jgi:hypothetical protein